MNPLLKQSGVNQYKDKAVKAAMAIDSRVVFKMAAYPLVRRGNQTFTSCPECGCLPKERKCSIGPSGKWYCFGCSLGGGAPQAYHLIYHTTWLESCVILAYKNGTITAKEYDALMNGSAVTRDKLNSDTLVYQEYDKAASTQAAVKAPPEVTDLVYRHLLALPEFKLNEEGYSHLIKDRGLMDQEIKEEGFFSYESTFSMKSLLTSIRKERSEFKPEDLMGVAGFYFLFKNEKEGWWVFHQPYEHCLGIPLRDSCGKIVALQMRNLMATGKDAKYFYISSYMIKDSRGKTGYGCSSGTPVAVTFPKKNIQAPICYIGEGIFKMREIAKEGVVSMSIQGINSYHYVAEEVKQMMSSKTAIYKSQKLADKELRFCIVFDSDMYKKPEVCQAACKFSQYLKKNFGEKRSISLLIWDPELGKGFDDFKYECVNRGISYADHCLRINSEDFIAMTRKAFSSSDEEYLKNHPEEKKAGIKIRQYPEWRSKLYNHLYEEQIKKVLYPTY